MEKIRMVDLVSQYEQIKEAVDKSVLAVMAAAQYINGPEVKDFASELEAYLNVRNAIPVANGTDALQIALMALGLQPGDEVITADFTFAATVEVIDLLRLIPVLVDVDYETFNISPKAVERAITPRTKAVIPVHLFGRSADMEAIVAIAEKHDLYVVEDAAQAIGAVCISSDGRPEKVGTIGHIGTTSFFPSKNLGCFGDGGALFTDDDGLATRIRALANHGMYHRYYHDEIGINSRLDSIQAAVLRKKLPHLDAYNDARTQAACYYDEAFRGHPHILTPKRDGEHATHVFHQYTLKIRNADRNRLKTHLEARGIPSMIYYPVPLHEQKAYRPARYKSEDFPVSDRLAKEVISLPMHTELTAVQLRYIAAAVLDFFRDV
ncbi:MAG: DegT/DnrJ/EryC1/StrS family aminotransferase [Flavobacteriales bacterium]